MDGDGFRQRQRGHDLRDFGECADRASSLVLILAYIQSNEHLARAVCDWATCPGLQTISAQPRARTFARSNSSLSTPVVNYA